MVETTGLENWKPIFRQRSNDADLAISRRFCFVSAFFTQRHIFLQLQRQGNFYAQIVTGMATRNGDTFAAGPTLQL